MEFKTESELVEWVYDMHLQNTNGRESHSEMFKLGIEAAIEELKELKLLKLPHSMKSVCAKCKAEDLHLIDGLCYGCKCLQG